MKNYNVKALIEFDDTLEQTHRTIGDSFKVTKERYEELTGNNKNKIVAVELIGIDKLETRKTRKKKEE